MTFLENFLPIVIKLVFAIGIIYIILAFILTVVKDKSARATQSVNTSQTINKPIKNITETISPETESESETVMPMNLTDILDTDES